MAQPTQVLRGWKRWAAVTAGQLCKVSPSDTVTISISGAGTCDIIAYMVSNDPSDTAPIARNKHTIETGATADAIYSASGGFEEVGIENVVGVINLEVTSGV